MAKVRWASRKEVAEALGVTPQRVYQLVKSGVIKETKRGIDLTAAKAAYRNSVDQSKANFRGKGKRKKAPVVPIKGRTGDLFDFNLARAEKEHHNARLAALKADELAGKLIPRDEVSAKEFAVARKLRDRILGWPARLAGLVPPEAMKTIVDECDQLCRELQEDAAAIAETSVKA